ncbi:MAG TPA: ABC transporter substrate-binding protein, partial [Azospira sp.]|nr:ABC transporter substrate-binding protein [Azospira sp.]
MDCLRSRRHLSPALVLLGLLLMAPAQAETVTLQLKWQHQFQFAGYYMAQEKGFYQDAGLQVNIVEGQADTDPVSEVLAG